MKRILVLAILFVSISASAQAYYPRFTDLFLNDPDESLFSPDLEYFRKDLKTIADKLFMGDLQTSNSASSAFYSFKIIPRLSEYNFLNYGVFLRFNVNSKDKYAAVYVSFEEFVDKKEASGNGRIDIENNDLSLIFDPKLVKVSENNQSAISNTNRAEFTIDRIAYKIDQTNLEIDFTGSFTTDINIHGKKMKKDAILLLTLNASKNKFAISYIDLKTKKKKFIIDENTKS